jgi:hypothetical protein
MKKENLFQELRKILLEEDEIKQGVLQQKIEKLDTEFNSKESLAHKMEPIIEDKFTYLRQHFPELFGPAITESIRIQIREAKDEVVEALYPIMGKLIQKYLLMELEVLSEKIDRQLEKAFSLEGWMIQVKVWFGGVKYSQHLIQQATHFEIEEAFVIAQDSGILLGSYSQNKSIDPDMVAGMLTAIKAFVKDAFTAETQELETIAYETYKIIIKNFKSYYIAAVISGVVTTSSKKALDHAMLDFSEKILTTPKLAQLPDSQEKISQSLKAHFSKFNRHEGQ